MFKKQFVIPCLLVISMALFSFTNAVMEKSKAIDLTTTTTISAKDFNSNSISIFGITPGMRIEEVESVIAKNKNLMLVNDQYNTDRVYLYDRDNNCLAYLIWNGRSANLNKIVMYKKMAKYIAGNGNDLFTENILNPNSSVFNYFGKHDSSRITLDVESIGLKHVSYFYIEKQLEVIRQDYNTKVEFMIVLHEKI